MKLEDLRKIAAQLSPPITSEKYQQLQQSLRQMGLDPDALYQELEMSSPYMQVHEDTSYSNETLQLHSHAFYEVLCCRKAAGAEYLVGTERYRLHKGDVIFVPPGVSHRPLLSEPVQEPYIRDVLWVSADCMEGLRKIFFSDTNENGSHDSLLRTAGTRWEYLTEILHTAVLEAQRALPGWEMVVMGQAVTFLAHLRRAFSDGSTITPTAEKPELLDRALTFIESHLSQKITLEEMAAHVYVSESTISQTFRKKMGVSFYRCVTQRRLISAKTLIQQGLSLETVAEQVGFTDYSAFYRAFKQEYGISPRQFRKLQEKEPSPMLGGPVALR